MTVTRMCRLGRVSRAGLYRFDPERERPDDTLDLRNEMQRIALEFPCYGRPRITAELKRRGWKVNHKRVARIMREDNLQTWLAPWNRPASTSCGLPTSPICGWKGSSFTWPLCWMHIHAESSAGPGPHAGR